MTMTQVKQALADVGPMSSDELSRHMGIKQAPTNKQIKQLRARREVRITRYDRQPEGTQGAQGAFIPVYALGDLPDAEQPKPQTPAKRNRKYQQRHAALISARRYPGARLAAGVWAGLL